MDTYLRLLPGTSPHAADQHCALCEASSFELVADRDREGRPLHTVLCTECGLVCTDPLPDAASLRDFHASPYRRTSWHSNEPRPRHAHREAGRALRRFERIRAHVRPGARTLDVGCGAGFFPYVLRCAGADARGLEPDEDEAAWGQRMLNLPIVPGFVEDLEPADGPYELITLFHVLGQLPDPGSALSRLHACLAADGVLVVEVPDVESTFHAPGQRFDAARLYNFNIATLCVLARRHGFEVESVRRLRVTQHLFAVLRRGKVRVSARESRMPENAYQVAAALAVHTAARHYASPVVHARSLARVLGHVAERAAAARFHSSREIVKHRVLGSLDSTLRRLRPRLARSAERGT
jgi:SAM-dependent methyltransferase